MHGHDHGCPHRALAFVSAPVTAPAHAIVMGTIFNKVGCLKGEVQLRRGWSVHFHEPLVQCGFEKFAGRV